MCRLSKNLGASTSWSPKGLSRPVMGLLYLYLLNYILVFTLLIKVKYLFYSAQGSCLMWCFVTHKAFVMLGLIFRVWIRSAGGIERLSWTAEFSLDQRNVKAIYILETLWTFHLFPWSTRSIRDRFQCFCDSASNGKDRTTEVFVNSNFFQIKYH
jgi:hypothetical protein